MDKRPAWYTDEHDKGWERVKAAFRNDWEQTKHDFGSDSARDLNQDVDDTVKQAMGFEKNEQAFRFGHSAQRQYRAQYPTWNSDLETRLRQDYGSDYDRDSRFIRHAYEYRGTGSTSTTDRPEERDRV